MQRKNERTAMACVFISMRHCCCFILSSSSFSFVRLACVCANANSRVRNGPQCHFNLHLILWRKRRRRRMFVAVTTTALMLSLGASQLQQLHMLCTRVYIVYRVYPHDYCCSATLLWIRFNCEMHSVHCLIRTNAPTGARARDSVHSVSL